MLAWVFASCQDERLMSHSASAFRINNQHVMEAATAADVTQASEIAIRYITLGIAAKAYVSDLTVLT